MHKLDIGKEREHAIIFTLQLLLIIASSEAAGSGEIFVIAVQYSCWTLSGQNQLNENNSRISFH